MERAQALARHLARARREGRQQSGLESTLVPPDPKTGYEIAALVERELGWEVVGWKIAATNAEMQHALRSDTPIYGRVYAPNIRSSPATFEIARLLSPIPEVEYQVRLGADLPPRREVYSQAEVSEAVASVHPGIEVAECRFIHDDAFPPLSAILADGAGSGTLVHGPAIEDWRQRDIAGQEVALYVDDERRRAGSARAAMGHPLQPLTWLANELSRTGIGLRSGQLISTGTMTGMLRPKAEQSYRADFGAFGQVEVRFV